MNADLFDGLPDFNLQQICLDDGAFLLRSFAKNVDTALMSELDKVIAQAPLRHMITPGGFRMSVAMSNCGQVGWITDLSGYRYDVIDPETGRPSSNITSGVGDDSSYYHVMYGQRPDMNRIFQQTKQRANEMGEYNIAVFACGPTSFMNDVQVACRTYSQSSIVGCHNNMNKDSGVYFDLHTEHFEY